MKVKYVGLATVRIVGTYTWNRENEYVQEVTEEDVLNDLLTNPQGDFELIDEQSSSDNPTTELPEEMEE